MSQFEVENIPADNHQLSMREDESSGVDSDAQALAPPRVGTLNEKHTRQTRGFRWLVLCVTIYIACFFYSLNTTITADVQGLSSKPSVMSNNSPSLVRVSRTVPSSRSC